MKIRSTKTVTIFKDRISDLTGYVEIEIKQTQKDDVSQQYTFETNDVLIVVTPEGENRHPITQTSTGSQTKKFFKSYAEYEGQKAALSQMFPNTNNMNPSEYDDYLLQMGLLLNICLDPIYTDDLLGGEFIGGQIVGSDWARIEDWVRPEN